MNDEQQTTLALAKELTAMRTLSPVTLQVDPFEAFSLLAALQLAWRHPELSRTQKDIIEGFGRELERAFAGYPVASRIAAAGWRVECDLPFARGRPS